MLRTSTFLLTGALLLTGCASGSTSAAGSDAAPSPSASPPAASEPPTTTEPAKAWSSQCRDKRGDGKGQDLARVVLKQVDDDLQVTWRLRTSVPQTGVAGWYVSVASADGETARQLGVKVEDSEVIAHFVFDFGDSQQEDVSTDPVIAARTVTATFPWDAVSDLGDGWQWSATSTLDGTDTDACPDAGTDTLNPKKITVH